MPGAYDGFGNIKYEAIDLVLRAYDVDDEEYRVLFEKILYFFMAFRAKRDEAKQQAAKPPTRKIIT